MEMIRFVCVSDTHGMLNHINVPVGDVLIHAGDLSSRGTLSEVKAEYSVLNAMPHKHIIVTPGNHDFVLQRVDDIVRYFAKQFPRVRTLIGKSATVAGIEVWADPWTPWFYDWAFNFEVGSAGERQAEARYSKIPDTTQLLVTHGPPRGILDRLDEDGTEPGAHVGSIPLRERIRGLPRLQAHIFGHIHCGYGTHREGDVLFVNAASCTEQYQPTNPPIVLDWTGKRFEILRAD